MDRNLSVSDPPRGITFGVEVECLVPREWAMAELPVFTQLQDKGLAEAHDDAIARLLDAPGLLDYVGARRAHQALGQCRYCDLMAQWPEGGWDHLGWDVHEDCSISKGVDGYVGAEFVSPVLSGPEGAAKAMAFLSYLKASGAVVDRTCGLHMHVGVEGLLRMRGLSLDTCTLQELEEFLEDLVAHVASREEELWATTSPARRGNSFCSSLKGELPKETVRKAKAAEKYRLLNVAPILAWWEDMAEGRPPFSPPTIEFRHLAGTMDEGEMARGLSKIWEVLLSLP